MSVSGFSISAFRAWWSRPRERIADVGALEDFMDRHAAFGVQKCIVEYCRARSGVLWQKLFKEQAFLDALNAARWHAFSIGVGNVAEMVDAALYARVRDERAPVLEGIADAGRHVMLRYPVPEGEPDDFWLRATQGFDERMTRVGLRAPRAVKNIPVDSARIIFEVLPIHPELRQHDFELVTNNLRVNLCRSYETFVAGLDADALIGELVAPRAAVRVPAL